MPSNRKQIIIVEIIKNNSQFSEINRQVKYGKMAESPFRFFRGTSHLFWKDFYKDERINELGSKATKIWITGDLHACNIGIFNNALGEIIFDVNDFDEAFIGDFQFDVWRMATSIVLVIREFLKLSKKKEAKLIAFFARQYLRQVQKLKDNNEALSLNFTKDNTGKILKKRLKDTEKSRGIMDMLDSWTVQTENGRVFKHEQDNLEKPSQKRCAEISAGMEQYGKSLSGRLNYDSLYFNVKDIARRLFAGTGSLGTPRYYILIEGASSESESCRILDLKLQPKPPVYEYMTKEEQSAFDKRFPSQGKRFIEANKAFILQADNHLGYMSLEEADFSVKQRSPFKADFGYENITKRKQLKAQSKQWAKVIATAHVRVSDRYFKESISNIYEDNLKMFENLVVDIAQNYADTVIEDYEVFKKHFLNKNQ